MLRVVFVFLALVVWAACGSNEAASTCDPGETQTCVGPGACIGGQICLQDGSGWGACDCDGVGQGGGPACEQGSCDDDNPCTADVCSAGEASNPPEAGAVACDHNGGSVCNGQGACVECFSNDDCTAPDTCSGNGTPWTCGCTPIACADLGFTCGYAENDGCGDTLLCDDGIQDGDETDVDCGGSVNACSTRCNIGQSCTTNPDCATNKCTAGSCQ